MTINCEKICSNCLEDVTLAESRKGEICKIVPTPKDDKNGDCLGFRPAKQSLISMSKNNFSIVE